MYRRVVGPLPEVPRVALTSKPAATLKNDYDLARDVILEGDSTALLAALWAALLETRSSPRQCAWPAPMTYENHPAARRLASAIGVGFAAGLGPRVLVDDSQMLGGLMAQNYNSLPDCHVIGSHGGFVGSGLATAAGVALGAPETQVLCLLGDQGFTNSVQALTVIAERNLNVSIIVCNNGKSVSLAKQRAAETGEPNGDIAFLQNPCRLDYTAAAKAFGIPAWRFTWSAEADASAADALSQVIAERVVERGPAFIELVTPSDQTFWAGIWTTTGFE